ncbi:MAG TPA: hypothetical protein VG860_02600 [Terriglobia bacterium]|jgi:hypothetical protein|nr:hypothetical protein [Terriglobia bacterium]
MKTRESKSRPRHALNQILNGRLISYATAATAAGVGILGLTPTADAQIVYTPTHVVISHNGSYGLDVNNDGTIDFTLHDSITANCSTVFNAILAAPALGNAVAGRGTYDRGSEANALVGGTFIGPNQKFVSKGGRGGILMGEAIDSPGGGQDRGEWVNVVNRYLGLRFEINGQTHFGWARLTVQISHFVTVKTTLSGYAYETQPDTPIIAGHETGSDEGSPIEPRIKGESGPDAARTPTGSPRPASLGLLALGAEGLPVWRRKQPVAA